METKRIKVGPRMREAYAYVARRGDAVALIDVARAVAPGRDGRIGLGFGYASVHRAIRAGLLYTVPHPTIRGRVLVRCEVVGADGGPLVVGGAS